jgi:hypothetical protein
VSGGASAPRSEARPAVRIVLRPIGSALTVSMSGLGIASLLESGLALHWIAADEVAQVGLALIAVPFVLQLLACVFSYLSRDGASGAAVGVLSTMWLAIGLVHLSTGTVSRNGALGLLLLGAGVALAMSATAVSLANPLAGIVFLLAALRFLLAGVYELGGALAWQHVAAIVGLMISLLASYAVLAFELEGRARRPLLPTFRKSVQPDAVHEGGDPLPAVAREPGVRRSA